MKKRKIAKIGIIINIFFLCLQIACIIIMFITRSFLISSIFVTLLIIESALKDLEKSIKRNMDESLKEMLQENKHMEYE